MTTGYLLALSPVYLAHQITDAIPDAAGGAAAGNLGATTPEVRAQLASPLSEAFGHTFWLALVLTALAYLPAMFLPRQPSRSVEPETESAETESVATAGPAKPSHGPAAGRG